MRNDNEALEMIALRHPLTNVIWALATVIIVVQLNTALSVAASRSDDQETAIRGLATVDSLLQAGQADMAVTTCRDLLSSLAK